MPTLSSFSSVWSFSDKADGAEVDVADETASISSSGVSLEFGKHANPSSESESETALSTTDYIMRFLGRRIILRCNIWSSGTMYCHDDNWVC